MIQDKEARLLLAIILEHIKEQQSAMSSVMNQLTSLRDVLKEASPNFADAFSERLAFWDSRTAKINAESNAIFDATIRQLRAN